MDDYLHIYDVLPVVHVFSVAEYRSFRAIDVFKMLHIG